LPAAITRVRRITVSYHSVDCSVWYSSVTMQLLWEIAFCRYRKSDAGLRIQAVRWAHLNDIWVFCSLVALDFWSK